MRRLEQVVRLTCFWVNETAKATEEVAYYAELTAKKVREYLKGLK